MPITSRTAATSIEVTIDGARASMVTRFTRPVASPFSGERSDHRRATRRAASSQTNVHTHTGRVHDRCSCRDTALAFLTCFVVIGVFPLGLLFMFVVGLNHFADVLFE